MINHFQTLLLNESASTLEASLPVELYGYVDQRFTEVKVDKDVKNTYDMLFSGLPDDGIRTRLMRVKRLLPYLSSPELPDMEHIFDRRVVTLDQPPDSVFSFYLKLEHKLTDIMPAVVASQYSPLVFNATGDSFIDNVLFAIKPAYGYQRETPRRFSVLLAGVALHLEAARRRSIA